MFHSNCVLIHSKCMPCRVYLLFCDVNTALVVLSQDNIIVVKDEIDHPMSIVSSTKSRCVFSLSLHNFFSPFCTATFCFSPHQTGSSARRWSRGGLPEPARHRLHPAESALHQCFWIGWRSPLLSHQSSLSVSLCNLEYNPPVLPLLFHVEEH